jgi:FkbM family methyltransferase
MGSVRNKVKDFYYKHLFYNFPVDWKDEYAEATVMGQKIKMNYFEKKNITYYNTKYFIGLVSLTKKIFGYLKLYNLKEGDIVIDAGAYEGEFTILASKLVGDTGKVISFEPTKEGYSKLLKNIALNNLINVVPINIALWNKKGKLKISRDFGASQIALDGDEIEADSLDNIINKLKLKRIDFLKADIEGSEIEMIEGAKQALANKIIKNFAIASYHIRNGEMTFKSLENTFKKFNYSVKVGFKNHLTTYAYLGADENGL